MAEYNQDDIQYSSEIVNALMEEDQPKLELRPSLVISDLEANSIEFKRDLDFLSAINQQVLALRLGDGDMVPVALSYFIYPPQYSNFRFFIRPQRVSAFIFEDIIYQYENFIKSLDDGPFTALSSERAKDIFKQKGTEFLATRVAGLRDQDSTFDSNGPRLNLPPRIGQPSISTPGCIFKVSTNTTGLRVHWSGAYWIQANYFGHPTTPASSTLQSGTYIFGVDGGAYNSIQWDTRTVVKLPGNPTVHLNY